MTYKHEAETLLGLDELPRYHNLSRIHFNKLFLQMADETLTELGASHEVVSCLFGVFAVHFAGFGVKLGEHVTVEAVKVFHKAESRRAVRHVLELFLIYSLCSDIVVVDFISCVQKKRRTSRKTSQISATYEQME